MTNSRCMKCGREFEWGYDELPFEIDVCPKCEKILRMERRLLT